MVSTRPGEFGAFATLLLPLLGLLGCSSEAEPGAPSGNDALCQALLPTCRDDQKACVVGSDGPRCEPCPTGQYANDAGHCTAIPGVLHEHEFPPFTSGPGQEILDVCRSWTVGNEQELWVNAVELLQDEASHHSNWTFVPETEFPGPDGLWDCDERGYSQLQAAVTGGVLYAQSTQAKKEVQKFPDGVVVRIPPHSKIISAAHVLNTTTAPVTGHITLRFYAIPPEAVTVKLAPFHLSYDGLDMPPRSHTRFSGECELDSQYQAAAGTPLGLTVYFILPHTHALGTRFFTEIAGGPNDGQTLIDMRGFNGEARGQRYTPPIDVTGATGLRFDCEFENPRDERVVWGFGNQEMCECLGFADSRLAFESRIDEAVPDGSDGDVLKFTGACNTIAFDWTGKQGD